MTTKPCVVLRWKPVKLPVFLKILSAAFPSNIGRLGLNAFSLMLRGKYPWQPIVHSVTFVSCIFSETATVVMDANGVLVELVLYGQFVHQVQVHAISKIIHVYPNHS
jgi:hypothetical protein